MMNIRILLATAIVALPAMPASAQSMTAGAYVAKAGAGDMYEKTSSQIVLTSTKNPAIRDFANGMITDHTKSTQKVKAAAMKAHVTVGKPHLTTEQNRMIAKLRAAKGDSRDTLYIDQQKTAHTEALALHQGYATSGKTPALRDAAAGIAPVVQHHIDMLTSM